MAFVGRKINWHYLIFLKLGKHLSLMCPIFFINTFQVYCQAEKIYFSANVKQLSTLTINVINKLNEKSNKIAEKSF